MQDTLRRLYRTKLALAANIATSAGVALLVVAQWADLQTGWRWLRILPVRDFGAVFLTSGLFGIFFEYLGRQDEEHRRRIELDHAVKQAAPDLRDAVVDGFAFTPETLVDVASDATLDRAIENCLAIRLGDKGLAHDTYADLYQQVVQTTERWRDVHVDVVLSPWDHGPASGEGSMFIATVKWEFRVTSGNPMMRFACVSDLDEYRSLSRDPATTETWYFKPIGAYDGASSEVFDLLQLTVNGKPRPIRRTARRGAQVFTAELGDDVARDEATVSYTYRTLVRRHGHLLRVEPARLTKGFVARLSYAGCGVQFVNTLDYIAGAWQARIEELPPSDPAPSVQVSYDGWVFPRGGVVFVWGLEDELRSDTDIRTPRSAGLVYSESAG